MSCAFNVFQFFNFIHLKFSLRTLIHNFLLDGRSHPSIPFIHIILSVFSMPLFNLSSLLQLDFHNRDSFIKALFKSSHRNMIASDSAITNTLYKMYRKAPESLGGVSSVLYHCFMECPQKNFIMDGFKTLVIDGSTFASHFGTALYVLGHSFDYLLDIVSMKNKGKEIPSAIKLARRLRKRFSYGYFSLLLYDGLCRYELIKKLQKIIGCDVLVKTKEKDLDVIQNAELLIVHRKNLDSRDLYVKIYEGYDPSRNEYYRIWEVPSVKRSNSPDQTEYKVIRVEEYEVKKVNGKIIKTNILKERYWIIGTNLTMSALLMRNFIIKRWRIENNGFKQLNSLTQSKHIYSHKKEIAFVLIALLVLAYNLFKIFVHQFHSLGEENKKIQFTMIYYRSLLAKNTYKIGGLSPPVLSLLNH